MKTILFILLLVGALVLGHNYLQTGKIGFNVSLSESERTLRTLDERLDDALRGYKVAGTTTSVGGLAPDSSAEHLANEVHDIEIELTRFKQGISDEELEVQIRALEAKIRDAKAEMGIP